MIVTQRLLPIDAATISRVLTDWQRQWPHLGITALVPEQEAHGVQVLQSVCQALDIALLGAVFPALVTNAGFTTEGVWLLCFDTQPSSFFIGDLGEQGSLRIAQAIEHALPVGHGKGNTDQTLLLIFDAMLPNIGSLMDEVHMKLPSPPSYSGVSAGSESFTPMPCLFDRLHLLGQGVIGMVLPAQTQAITRHSYPVSKSLMRASSAQGNRIARIDGRPAFDVYQEIIFNEYGVTLGADNFYSLAVHFPFGVVTAFDVLVRIPVGLDDDGSLYCVGEIPPDSMLRLLRAPALAESDCVSDICTSLQCASVDTEDEALLTFYCAGRRMHFGDAAATELMQLKAKSASNQLYGALSLGEMDSLEEFNFPRFHNAALVCIAQSKH